MDKAKFEREFKVGAYNHIELGDSGKIIADAYKILGKDKVRLFCNKSFIGWLSLKSIKELIRF